MPEYYFINFERSPFWMIYKLLLLIRIMRNITHKTQGFKMGFYKNCLWWPILHGPVPERTDKFSRQLQYEVKRTRKNKLLYQNWNFLLLRPDSKLRAIHYTRVLLKMRLRYIYRMYRLHKKWLYHIQKAGCWVTNSGLSEEGDGSCVRHGVSGSHPTRGHV